MKWWNEVSLVLSCLVVRKSKISVLAHLHHHRLSSSNSVSFIHSYIHHIGWQSRVLLNLEYVYVTTDFWLSSQSCNLFLLGMTFSRQFLSESFVILKFTFNVNALSQSFFTILGISQQNYEIFHWMYFVCVRLQPLCHTIATPGRCWIMLMIMADL